MFIGRFPLYEFMWLNCFLQPRFVSYVVLLVRLGCACCVFYVTALFGWFCLDFLEKTCSFMFLYFDCGLFCFMSLYTCVL